MHQPHFTISGSDHYSGSAPGRGSGSLALNPLRISPPGLFAPDYLERLRHNGISAPQFVSIPALSAGKGHYFVSKKDRLGKADHAKPQMMVEKEGNMVWKYCDVKPRNPHLFVTLLPTCPAYTRAGQLTASAPTRTRSEATAAKAKLGRGPELR
jgi:hypothetical protein